MKVANVIILCQEVLICYKFQHYIFCGYPDSSSCRERGNFFNLKATKLLDLKKSIDIKINTFYLLKGKGYSSQISSIFLIFSMKNLRLSGKILPIHLLINIIFLALGVALVCTVNVSMCFSMVLLSSPNHLFGGKFLMH